MPKLCPFKYSGCLARSYFDVLSSPEERDKKLELIECDKSKCQCWDEYHKTCGLTTIRKS